MTLLLVLLNRYQWIIVCLESGIAMFLTALWNHHQLNSRGSLGKLRHRITTGFHAEYLILRLILCLANAYRATFLGVSTLLFPLFSIPYKL